MTKQQYIDYHLQWLARAAPDAIVSVAGDLITVEHRGMVRTGFPVDCYCGAEDCLGWVMVTVRKHNDALKS